MSSGFEKLKEIGAQKIHEQTHIPKMYTYAIVAKNFEKMNRIQFLGFISILEREYSIKLNELKNEGEEYFVDNTKTFTIAKKVFVPAAKKRSFKKYYFLLAIVVLFIIAISSFSTEDEDVSVPVLDSEKIIQATQKIVTEVEEPIMEEIVVNKTLKIIPDKELWMGYTNLQTGEKFQKTFSGEFELDGNVDWLFSLGHGKVTFEIDGRTDQYKTFRTIRFLYKEGNLKKISYAEYLDLNKGEKW